MTNTTRLASLAAALTLGIASSSAAQGLATFGSAELAGYGEGSALLGTSLTIGTGEWAPIVSLIGQTYRYRSSLTTHDQAYAVTPSVGLRHSMPGGSVQGTVGYTFVNTEFNSVVAGGEGGGRNGVVVAAQGNYWGSGENTAQLIGSYGFGSEYYWTRGRAAHRLAPSANPVYLGGEVVLQGTSKFTPSVMRFQVGPTIEYRVSPDFRVGASAGYRGGNNNVPGSGYGRIEFLLLSHL